MGLEGFDPHGALQDDEGERLNHASCQTIFLAIRVPIGKTKNMCEMKVLIRLYPPLLAALLLVQPFGEGVRVSGLGLTHASSSCKNSNKLDTRGSNAHSSMCVLDQLLVHSSSGIDTASSRRKLRDKTQTGVAAQRHLLNHFEVRRTLSTLAKVKQLF
eukprot:1146249-Pelagomonas_calceolata.AAC.7